MRASSTSFALATSVEIEIGSGKLDTSFQNRLYRILKLDVAVLLQYTHCVGILCSRGDSCEECPLSLFSSFSAQQKNY